MAMELMWPYVKSHSNPSVEGYLAWIKEQKDPLYLTKFEQVNYLIFILQFSCLLYPKN
jgi:hypothetical protein